MESRRITNRRQFLRLSALGAAGALLAACAQTPASPTTAPAAPTTVPKAAEATKPAASPTVAAVASPTVAATVAAKPTAAAVASPTAAAAASPTVAAKPTAAPTVAPTAVAITATGPTIDKIKKAGKFIVLMDATFKPMEYVDGTNVVGADVDLANEIAKELGVKAEIQKTAWDAIFAGLKAGRGDAIMSSVTITDSRKKEMLFSDTYFASGQLIAVRADNTTIKSEKDLVGKVVGVQIDTTGQEAVQAIAGVKEIKKYDGGADTMAAVDANKVEAAVMDAPVALAYVKEHPTVKVVSHTPFTTEPYGIAIKLDATDLQLFINQALAKIKADGRLDAIFAKYGLK